MADNTDATVSSWENVRQVAKKSFTTLRADIAATRLFPDLHGEAGVNLREAVREDGNITKSYMLMCGLAAGIAALGLLQSSTAVVIGAMLISPLMGPIASMGFGFSSLDGHQIRDAVKVIAVGAAIGIIAGVLLTWASPIRNATPEIIARTEPTLLDLAVAVFSGIAGAYATVWQKGATAIGVAIATALMPPLATVGYGLGVGNLAFAFGAFLLFLTNLAAIAFSFALIARLSGAARPFARVEVKSRYVVAGIASFIALATPLCVTLYRVTAEARAQATVRQLLEKELKVKSTNIAQLQVRWPLRGVPSVNAVVISPEYSADAERRVLAKLEAEWGERASLSLQQVVAADVQAQTQAIVDAAVETSAAGVARDQPPLNAIRSAIGLPIQALWVNRAERVIQMVPFAAEGWQLGDFREAENSTVHAAAGWSVKVIPPVEPVISIPIPLLNGTPQVDKRLGDAMWAIRHWAVQDIRVVGYADGNGSDESRATALSVAQFAVDELSRAGIRAKADVGPPRRAENDTGTSPHVEIEVVRKPPSATP